MSTVVTSKGQVTIPKRVRDFLGIGPGTAVDFEMTPDGRVVMVRARGRRTPSRFARLRGSLKSEMSTDELLALTRGEN